MNAIRELIEIVEQGQPFPLGRKADARGDDPLTLARNWGAAYDAYHGSLDAACALHEVVLPDWGWEVGTMSGSATVYPPDYPGKDFEAQEYSSEADTPARAWLLAILRALEAQQCTAP
jgi:hypothetical protein